MKFDDEKIQEILEREDIQIAPMDKRFLAFLIDNVLISVLMFIIYFDKFASYNGNDFSEALRISASIFLPTLAVFIAYETFFVCWYGATLGKMVFKIRVITIDLLDSPKLLTSLTRAVLLSLSQILYYIPFVFAFGDSFRRTLYDRVCKTIVISQKN